MRMRWVLATMLLAAPSAGADTLEAEREFHVIDTDGDGAIQPTDAAHSTEYPLLPYVFDAVDLDGSGAIEHDEWGRARFYLRSLDAGGPGVPAR